MFDAVSLGNLTLKNRFVRSATGEAMADERGEVKPELIRLYTDLAKGEVGLIISGHANVQEGGSAGTGQIGIYEDSFMPGLEKLTDAVHHAGGKIVIQLAHMGIWGDKYPQGPSDCTINDEINGHAMEVDEIETTVKAFADAAFRAQKAGFDGVQIHAAHGYLLGEFLSAFYNKRNDAYGGSLVNRARILIEVLGAIREKVGRDYHVMVKINADDFLEEGFIQADMLKVCTMLEATGLDSIELSGGTIHPLSGHGPARPDNKGKEAWYRKSAERLKSCVDIPVILVGGIRTFTTAQELVIAGSCDAVSLSRPLIRQPDLIRRWKFDNTEQPVCIACNRCFGPVIDGSGLRCVQEEKRTGE